MKLFDDDSKRCDSSQVDGITARALADRHGVRNVLASPPYLAAPRALVLRSLSLDAAPAGVPGAAGGGGGGGGGGERA